MEKYASLKEWPSIIEAYIGLLWHRPLSWGDDQQNISKCPEGGIKGPPYAAHTRCC